MPFPDDRHQRMLFLIACMGQHRPVTWTIADAAILYEKLDNERVARVVNASHQCVAMMAANAIYWHLGVAVIPDWIKEAGVT